MVTKGNALVVPSWRVPRLRHSIVHHRASTWSYQDRAGVGRTPSSHMEAKTESVPYLAWMKHLWAKRHHRARVSFLKHRLPWTGDWVNAVRIVQRVWPGTSAWLLSCSSGEGGHGPFVMNYQGSGAGGWLQYMYSTFVSHINAALDQARRLHRALPPMNARGWTSPLGQAFAGGWARWNHNTGAWDPGKDPACA